MKIMNKDSGSAYRNGWDSGFRPLSTRAPAAANTDPTIVSLTDVEFRRLVDIETAAQIALQAMNIGHINEAEFSKAADALDVALNSPTFGG
jgi:hypothetical protein